MERIENATGNIYYMDDISIRMLSHLSEPSSAKMSETSTYHILLVAVITHDLRATPKPTSTPSATPEVIK